jgi:hypothetical protein
MLNLRAPGGGGFGLQPPMSGGVGLNNVGLLIKSAGKVTSGYPGGSGWITDQLGRTCAYIDEGSGLGLRTRNTWNKDSSRSNSSAL